MSPEYTDCAVSSTAPLNRRSLRVLRRVVVLQRAEVEHLVAVAEVDRGEVGLGTRRRRAATRCAAARTRRPARPPTTSASRRARGARAAARPATCAGRAPAPTGTARGRCRRRSARPPRRRGGRCVRAAPRVGGAEAVEHRDLGALLGDHERVREAGEAVALRPVQHHDRALDDDDPRAPSRTRRRRGRRRGAR